MSKQSKTAGKTAQVAAGAAKTKTTPIRGWIVRIGRRDMFKPAKDGYAGCYGLLGADGRVGEERIYTDGRHVLASGCLFMNEKDAFSAAFLNPDLRRSRNGESFPQVVKVGVPATIEVLSVIQLAENGGVA